VADYGLQQHLHLTGLCEDMPALYRELDVLVGSSHSEAMPLALMEAMASGLPVVATRVGGVPDMVEHGQTGWLVAPGDFQDIAARCHTLLGDAALRRRMGERARMRAVQRLALDACVARSAALLQRLARPPLPAAAPGPALPATAASGTPARPVVSAAPAAARSRGAAQSNGA